MTSTYYLEENELNEEFLSSVKQLFKNKKLAITVQEELDETEYLLKIEANKERLVKALTDVKYGKNGVQVDIDDLKSNLF